MENSKIFTFLRKLTKKECSDFYQYLKRSRGEAHEWTRVLAYLQKFHPDYADEYRLEAGYICRKVFGAPEAESKSARKKLLNIFSFLNAELETFLRYQQLDRSEHAKNVLWLEVLQARGLDEEYDKQAALFYETTKNAPKTELKDYLQEMAANYWRYQNLSKSPQYNDFDTLQGCLDAWRTAADIVHTKMASDLASRKAVLRPKAPDPTPSPLAQREVERLNAYPYAQLCREAHALISTGETQHYIRLETLFFEHVGTLEQREAHWFAKYLKNYMAEQMRLGRIAEFAPKVHALDRLGWENGFFSKNADLTPSEFNNVVNVASAVNQPDWAKRFIREHADVFPEEDRGNAVALAHATLAFDQKAYGDALKLLHNKKFKKWDDIIRSKILLLRIYYEQREDIERVLKKCARFEAQLRNPQMPQTDATKAAKEFVSLYKQLVKQKIAKEALLKQIEKTTPLYAKEWLVEKAKKYKKI